MIDREKIDKCLDALEKLGEEDATLKITQDGKIELAVYPRAWWRSGKHWSDEKRHSMLSLLTPLVGKLEKQVDGGNIGYRGEKDDILLRLNYIDQCKIMGYKTVTKTVKKEIEKPVEYEVVEEEQRITITDCDIRQGKFSEDDIEVRA